MKQNPQDFLSLCFRKIWTDETTENQRPAVLFHIFDLFIKTPSSVLGSNISTGTAEDLHINDRFLDGYRLLELLPSTFKSLATSPAVTGCIAALCARNTENTSCRYFSKLNTSLKNYIKKTLNYSRNTNYRIQSEKMSFHLVKWEWSWVPEKWSCELHPALFCCHLQCHGNCLLPSGPNTQPQPPAGRTANEIWKGLKQRIWCGTHLKRISEFIQVLRS